MHLDASAAPLRPRASLGYPRRTVHALWLAFLSGGPALVYQVVWTREVALLAGIQIDAVATVVAAFFGGLAFGSRVLGARVDASSRPLRFYAALELSAAALAIVATLVLRALHASGPDHPMLMLCACALAIFPVTFLLGGTQPALLRSTGTFEGEATAPAGRIQGINTAGAVLGVLVAAAAIPTIGLWSTLLAGTGTAALVGGLALVFDLRNTTVPEPSSDAPDTTTAPALPLSLLALAGLAGIATLGFEVLSTRMAALWLGSSLYAWALVLALFLSGLAAGNLSFSGAAARTRHPAALLASLQAAAAIALALGIAALHPPLARPAGGIGLGSLAAVAFGTLPAAFLMGGAFPLFARLVLDTAPGRSFGALSAWNTAGGILGSLLAPLVLLPTLGMLGGAIACSALNFAVAAAVLRFDHAQGRAAHAGLATAVYAMAVVIGASGAQRGQPEGSIHIEHGRHASAVVRDLDGERELIVDGDSEAFTGGDALRTETMLAAIPLALHPNPKHFLEVGFGAGITLGTASRFPLDSIECVEISGAVLRSAPFLEPANRGVLRNEKLVVHHRDARAFLRTTTTQHDVVVANTLHPWSLGATGLYSSEYFGRFAAAVAPGGLAAQWIPTQRITAPSFRSILRTFFDAFEHGYVFWGAGNVILVASQQPIALPDEKTFSSRLARGGFAPQQLQLGEGNGDALPQRVIARASDVRALIGEEEVLRDDRPRLEADATRGFAAHDAEVLATLVQLSQHREESGRPAGHPALVLWLESLAAREAGNAARANSREALARSERLGLAQLSYARRLGQKGRRALKRSDLGAAEEIFEEVREADPGSRDAAFGLSAIESKRGNADAAARVLQRWLETSDADAGGWNQLAGLLADAGHTAEAAKAVDRALEANPYFSKAIANAALLAAARGDNVRAQLELQRLRSYGSAAQAAVLESELGR